MQTADGSRVCQYKIAENPLRKCGKSLVGRGRHKWCPLHQAVVRGQQHNEGNARWQRAWRQRYERSVLSGIATPKSINRICNLLKKKYDIRITKSIRKKLGHCLRATLIPKSEADFFTMVYSFLDFGYDVITFCAADMAAKKSRPASGLPPECDRGPSYLASLFIPTESKAPHPELTRYQFPEGGIDQILPIFVLWLMALGWDGNTEAVLVRLGSLNTATSTDFGICYVKFLKQRKYRHDILWIGEPKAHNPQDPSNRLNRLLSRGLDELDGDETAIKKNIIELVTELNLRNSLGE